MSNPPSMILVATVKWLGFGVLLGALTSIGLSLVFSPSPPDAAGHGSAAVSHAR